MFQLIKRAAASVANAATGKVNLFPDTDGYYKTKDENGLLKFLGNGVISIVRTGGTGAPGTTDTYTITYSDATTTTYTVANGANGTNGVGAPSTTTPSAIAQTGAIGTGTSTYANSDHTHSGQPYDDDLTAIAALTTTPYGRSQLTYADKAAATADMNAVTAVLPGLMIATDKVKIDLMWSDSQAPGLLLATAAVAVRAGNAVTMAANTAKVGSKMRFTTHCTNAATISVNTISARLGVNNTNVDAALLSLLLATGTAVVGGAKIVIEVDFLTIGATGTAIVSLQVFNNGITGFTNVAIQSAVGIPVTINTTVLNYVGAYVSPSVANVVTIRSSVGESVSQ